MRRYVYRGPAEPAARATASGSQNVITMGSLGAATPSCGERWKHFFQVHDYDCGEKWKAYKAAHPHDRDPWKDFRESHPHCAHPEEMWQGFIEAHPDCAHTGRALQGMGDVWPTPWTQDRGPCPAWGCDGPPRIYPVYRNPGLITLPWGSRPSWWVPPGAGATSMVPQPPPSSGGTLLVPVSNAPPISPQPAPVTAGDTSLSLTQPGQTLAQQTGTPWDIATWLGESTLFSSLPNWAVAGGALVAAWFLFSGKGGRR